MKLHAEETERGWELADETGTFECEALSTVYPSRAEADCAADRANFDEKSFDELQAMERSFDY
jgi:hypothetical protein